MPKVSVIVPVYNVEKYIEKCLNSLVNQTLKDVEIIVVNDGSLDKSEEKIKPYLDKIKYYKKENGGLSDARNYGLKYATGEYVGFVDSDDYIDVNMYKKMYSLAECENSDIVECDFYWVYPNKNVIDTRKEYKAERDIYENGRVLVCNKIFKRELLERKSVSFLNGLYYEDIDFFYKLLPSVSKVSYLPKGMYYYVQRDTSQINRQTEKTKDIFIILYNIIKYYKKLKIYDEYKDELEYLYIRILLGSSFLRMIKIKDKLIRKECLNSAWNELNEKFPMWKKNKILNTNKTVKKIYFKTNNAFTYKLYSKIFRIIKRG